MSKYYLLYKNIIYINTYSSSVFITGALTSGWFREDAPSITSFGCALFIDSDNTIGNGSSSDTIAEGWTSDMSLIKNVN